MSTQLYRFIRASLALVLVAGLAWAAAPAQAATIAVTTTADELNADGDCSLREAIVAANTDAAVDACPAGSGADTINLASGATYALTISVADASLGATGLPTVTSDITLQGNGSTIRRASGTFRILRIDSGATLTLNNVTIRDGLAEVVGGTVRGGGIYNQGTLTLTNNSAVRSNSITINVNATTAYSAFGGGIFSTGVLIISNSTVSNNTVAVLNLGTGSALGFGGGIYASGTVTLTESGIGDNSLTATAAGGGSDSASGGGLYVSGSTLLTITDTTIRNNQAVGVTGANGGGVFAVSATLTMTGSTVTGNTATGSNAATGGTVGGGMTLNGSTTATIVNSTISGNSAAGSAGNNGGGISNAGSLELIQVTLSDNRATTGGGIRDEDGTLTFLGVIVAGNLAGGSLTSSTADCDFGPTINTSNNNLTGLNTGCALAGAGNRTIVPALVSTTLLGPLADNGGPTRTHALRIAVGNPAVDAGDNSVCAAAVVGNVDQRGEARPFDGDGSGAATCDIGAFELRAVLPTATPTSTSTPTATPTPTNTPSPTLTATAGPTPGTTYYLYFPEIQQGVPESSSGSARTDTNR